VKTLEETAGPEGSGALTRRQLLKGALSTAIVGGLVAAGGASPSAAQSSKTATTSGTLKPKPGGDFRLGVTGGAPSDMIDGQNFLDTPDQARLVSQFETLLVFDDDYKVTNDGWPRKSHRTARHSGRSACARESSSPTARRCRPKTSSTPCSGYLTRRTACRIFSAGLDRRQGDPALDNYNRSPAPQERELGS